MKKILLLFVLLLATNGLRAQGTRFFEGTFEEALAKAAAENKKVFVDFYAKWCVYCKKMEAEAFPVPEVGDYFNSRFVTIKIDAETEAGKPLALKYEVTAYPTLLIVDAAGEEIASVEGGMNADQLLRWARSEMGDLLTFEQMFDKLKSDKNNDALIREILMAAPDFLARQTESYQYDRWEIRVNRLYKDYLKRKSYAELMNPADFKVLLMYHTEPSKNDELFEYVAANYDTVKDLAGADQVNMFLFMLNMTLTQELAEKGDLEYLNRLERIKGDLKPAYDAMLKHDVMSSYECMKYLNDATYCIYKGKNVKQYISLMDEYLAKLGDSAEWRDYSSAIDVLYGALDGKLPTEAVLKGIEWISRALQFDGLDVGEQMNLLIMNGDCYKMLPDKENALKCYKQAYAVGLQFENPSLSAQIQRLIDEL